MRKHLLGVSIAVVSFSIAWVLVPRPEPAGAFENIPNMREMAECIFDNKEGMASDRGADYVVIACQIMVGEREGN